MRSLPLQKIERPKPAGTRLFGCQMALLGLVASLAGFNVHADSTNSTPPAPAAPRKLDESSFRIINERNIFNANRSGGTVRSTSSRRAARVDSFALVGTMAYEKGAFAFFEGTSSEFTKALKPNGIIAGHKIMDILANGVKLEMDGQIIELAIGTGLRREDQGAWKVSDAVSTSGNSSARSAGESNGREGRGRGDENNGAEHNSTASSAASPAASADQSEVLKRLMERREKENQ